MLHLTKSRKKKSRLPVAGAYFAFNLSYVLHTGTGFICFYTAFPPFVVTSQLGVCPNEPNPKTLKSNPFGFLVVSDHTIYWRNSASKHWMFSHINLFIKTCKLSNYLLNLWWCYYFFFDILDWRGKAYIFNINWVKKALGSFQ